MKPIYKAVFAAIILLAAVLRLWHLSDIPSGFHADEAAFGYNAYSILKTGRDEYGKFLPLELKSFGDYKGAIYAYTVIPFLPLFGLSELSVRLPSAIAGVGIIVLSYLFVVELTRRRDLALVVAGVTALSPVSILLSRVQSDPLQSVAFMLAGIYLFLRFLRGGRILAAAGSVLFLAISYYTYYSPRVFAPLILLMILAYSFPAVPSVGKKTALFIIGFAAALTVFLSTGTSVTRTGQVSIFNSDAVTLVQAEKIREDGVSATPPIVSRVFHGKPVEYGRYVVSNLSKYLGFDFLFFQITQPDRERIPDTGLLFLVELPLLAAGIYAVIRKRIVWGYGLFVWILAVAGVLSFGTHETPNIHRFYIAMLPLYMLIGLGILEVYGAVKKQWRLPFLGLLAFLYAVSLLFFLHTLFANQPVHDPYFRGYAYKEMVAKLLAYRKTTDTIVVTKGVGSPYIFILFYAKFDPALYQSMGSPRDLDNARFDKYVFLPEDCPAGNPAFRSQRESSPSSILFINRGDCKTVPGFRIIDRVYWKNSMEAFQFVRYEGTPAATLK